MPLPHPTLIILCKTSVTPLQGWNSTTTRKGVFITRRTKQRNAVYLKEHTVLSIQSFHFMHAIYSQFSIK